jgi:hypothetical protein
LTRFERPSLLERANMVKGLHRMPAADCGDYEEIPEEKIINLRKYNKHK